MPAVYAGRDDLTVTDRRCGRASRDRRRRTGSARARHPDVVELDLDEVVRPPPSAASNRRRIVWPAKASIETDARPPGAVDVARRRRRRGRPRTCVPSDRSTIARKRVGRLEARVVGEDVARRSGAGRSSRAARCARRADRSSGRRGRWRSALRAGARARHEGPRAGRASSRAASGRGSWSRPGCRGRTGRWPAPCRCRPGSRVQPR